MPIPVEPHSISSLTSSPKGASRTSRIKRLDVPPAQTSDVEAVNRRAARAAHASLPQNDRRHRTKHRSVQTSCFPDHPRTRAGNRVIFQLARRQTPRSCSASEASGVHCRCIHYAFLCCTWILHRIFTIPFHRGLCPAQVAAVSDPLRVVTPWPRGRPRLEQGVSPDFKLQQGPPALVLYSRRRTRDTMDKKKGRTWLCMD